MSFTPKTSRFNVVAFRRVAVILALLTAGFGLAYATAPVAVMSSGNLLSPTGYVDTADARSLPNGFPGLVDLRGWGVRLDSNRGPLSSPASAIPNVPLVGQNPSAPSSIGGDDGSINTHIHARDHDLSITPFTFPRWILAAIPKVPPAGQKVSALSPNDASITFACCSYNPTVVTITVGESVSWSGNFASHPLRQVDGPTSDVLVPGGFANSTGTFYSVQFNSPGTFYYQCAFHGQFGGPMRGQIVVLGPPTATPTPTSTWTNTPVPSTNTPTPTSTRTNTPVPSTNTPTPTATRTNTPVPPTNTPTPTATQTNTPVPPINTPTTTATLTPTNTPTSTPTIAPRDWHLYLPTVNR
jgi:plastocyanin